MGLKTDEKLF